MFRRRVVLSAREGVSTSGSVGAVIRRFLRLIRRKNLTIFTRTPKIGETREVSTPETREVKSTIISGAMQCRAEHPDYPSKIVSPRAVERCPYCEAKDIIKRGRRKKKYELAQLYYCYHCKKTFTTPKAKGKSFPLRIILESLSLYNLGLSAEQACSRLKEQFSLEVKPRTLRDWVHEYDSICRYSRLRTYGLKLYSPNQVIQTVHLFHRQVYDFSVHRAKLALTLQEHKHAKFYNLREFLDAVQGECPHQFFQEGERISEQKVSFSLEKVILRKKHNFANRIAELVLQAVSDNKLRHKTLQRFMLCNDSVTVAVEVPVYMDRWDLKHMQEQLKFKIPFNFGATSASVITGHIDILQLRNGAVHILDYKPNAAKGKMGATISQLTLYALALSRLTGLRLYDFKCAWFDEQDYFEFFPLHVVYKLRERAKKESPEQLKFDSLVDTEVADKGDHPTADIAKEA